MDLSKLGTFQLIGRNTLKDDAVDKKNKIAKFFCVNHDNDSAIPYIIITDTVENPVDAGNDIATLETALAGKVVLGLNWVAVLKLLYLARKGYSIVASKPTVKALIDAVCIFGNEQHEEVVASRQDGIIAIVHSIHSAATLLGTDAVQAIIQDEREAEIPEFNSTSILKRYRWTVKFLIKTQNDSANGHVIKEPTTRMVSDIHTKYLNEQSANIEIIKLLQTPKSLFEDTPNAYLVNQPKEQKPPKGVKGVEDRFLDSTRRNPIRKILGYSIRQQTPSR